ncbi:hypothetical protein MKZ38_004172 [Zalerion maritima]|uniref:Uncharacterized protein n=1 Tax=Zalerion maritima TaxID=339359 RepID=A0AAD5RN84_9PEZI|nr:hypothetical protein MKZ38_004172 [Zalerion maritima]
MHFYSAPVSIMPSPGDYCRTEQSTCSIETSLDTVATRAWSLRQSWNIALDINYGSSSCSSYSYFSRGITGNAGVASPSSGTNQGGIISSSDGGKVRVKDPTGGSGAHIEWLQETSWSHSTTQEHSSRVHRDLGSFQLPGHWAFAPIHRISCGTLSSAIFPNGDVWVFLATHSWNDIKKSSIPKGKWKWNGNKDNWEVGEDKCPLESNDVGRCYEDPVFEMDFRG